MDNTYKLLLSYILPKEISDSFDLVDVNEVVPPVGEPVLTLKLEEKAITPDNRTDLEPNGFYPTQYITDFPIRERKVILHVRRRRWKDAHGKSVSKDWKLVAKGTRISVEFAAF